MTTVKDWGISVIRTEVPVVVGLLAGLANQKLGWTIGTETLATVDAQVVVAVGALYYAGIRALELKWPSVGIMLGWNVAPSYTARFSVDPTWPAPTLAVVPPVDTEPPTAPPTTPPPAA